MPDDVEEAALTAGLAEALRDGPPGGTRHDQLAHVDDRDVGEVARPSHEASLRATRSEPRLAVPRIPRDSTSDARGPRPGSRRCPDASVRHARLTRGLQGTRVPFQFAEESRGPRMV